MQKRNRTVFLLHCSCHEAHRIREAAAHQRRTISAYVLGTAVRAIRYDDSLARLRALRADARLPVRTVDSFGIDAFAGHPVWPRTTMLLSCSHEDSLTIRVAAKDKEMTISGLILGALRRAWMVEERS